jgi:hypothetical protein
MTVQIHDHILFLTTSIVMANQAVCPFADRETKLNFVALVRKRNIQTDQPPLVGEVNANFD